MKELSKNEIKTIQLDILQSIHQFCETNNIRYSLAYGTLLGAIRHKGYIPWDDDIDVMMPRPDYERFIQNYPNFCDRYIVQTYNNDDSYYLWCAKVYDNRTEQITFPTKSGVCVDVFPIDGLPDTLEEVRKYIKMKRKLFFRRLVFTCRNNSYRPGNKFVNAFKYIIKRILVPSRSAVIKQIEQLYKSYPYSDSNYVGDIIDLFGERGWLKKEIFEDYTIASFENLQVKIIKDYDTFLKARYGDYLQLPPEEERVPGHAAPVYWKE